MFAFTVVPRFDDVDAMGIVNNARFFTYAEEGRLAFIRSCGLMGRGFIVARIECDYRRSIVLADGPVTVEAAVERVGRSSATFRQVLSQKSGPPAAEMTVVLVGYDAANSRSRPFDEDERAILLAHGPSPAPTA